MIFNDTFLAVLEHEGVVTIISSTAGYYHAVNTWNSYVKVDGDKLYIPAAGMHSVEQDLAENDQVLLTIGSREVEGLVGPGTGFHVFGTASFVSFGEIVDQMKKEFPFLTRVLVIEVTGIEQKI
ncbi:pyridoxamine 5'-phosphate oxidase family protein [Enterococcus xiangfangensis]|uniref:pyridoxamine 5'-phosphate oxidase family protein n=1 Tax=Enterococcus xiangfangensis TaxID=1296537 RepID=UPI0010FA1335|nr:pyridoxamine 5'-phosphate oxidase family protein [Enterococcus xiangfangensis]MBM7711149.1 hypothetical protein [Enterococcus xiangfangensis]